MSTIIRTRTFRAGAFACALGVAATVCAAAPAGAATTRNPCKLLKPAQRVKDLLRITKLHTVFEVYDDEAAAVASFG